MSFTAVVMAAGQGTRMKSGTPKVLHDVCGRPMVHWPVLAAREAGADRVIVVGGPDGALDGNLPEGSELAVQPVANGTGGAVAAVADLLSADETVVVINGDAALITAEALAKLVAGHARANAQASVATVPRPRSERLRPRRPRRRRPRAADRRDQGPRRRDRRGARDRRDQRRRLRLQRRGAESAAPAPAEPQRPGRAVPHRPHRAGGQRRGRRPRRPRRCSSASTTAPSSRAPARPCSAASSTHTCETASTSSTLRRRPSTPTCTIDADATLEPGTVLRGATQIGPGATIGPSSTLIDTTVGERSKLIHTYATGATIQAGVSVGPFAYLRPGTLLRDGSKIGTFVEVKNSDIGEGTKVPAPLLPRRRRRRAVEQPRRRHDHRQLRRRQTSTARRSARA